MLVQDTDVPIVRWVMKTTSLSRSLTVKHGLSEEDGILRNISVKPRKTLWKPNWDYKQDIFHVIQKVLYKGNQFTDQESEF